MTTRVNTVNTSQYVARRNTMCNIGRQHFMNHCDTHCVSNAFFVPLYFARVYRLISSLYHFNSSFHPCATWTYFVRTKPFHQRSVFVHFISWLSSQPFGFFLHLCVSWPHWRTASCNSGYTFLRFLNSRCFRQLYGSTISRASFFCFLLFFPAVLHRNCFDLYFRVLFSSCCLLLFIVPIFIFVSLHSIRYYICKSSPTSTNFLKASRPCSTAWRVTGF